jgi:hypothetical protein
MQFMVFGVNPFHYRTIKGRNVAVHMSKLRGIEV